jgi:hypothetical protein
MAANMPSNVTIQRNFTPNAHITGWGRNERAEKILTVYGKAMSTCDSQNLLTRTYGVAVSRAPSMPSPPKSYRSWKLDKIGR